MNQDFEFSGLPGLAKHRASKAAPAIDALDAAASSEMAETEMVDDDETRRLPLWLMAVVVVALLGLGARLFYLQVTHGSYYRGLAQGNRLRIEYTLAPRGIILDRNNNILVQNVPSFDAVVIPTDLPAHDVDRKTIAEKLSGFINMPAQEIMDVFAKVDPLSYQAVPVKPNIDRDQALLLQTKLQDLPGVSIANSPRRDYFDGPYFAHVLGYTGRLRGDDEVTDLNKGNTTNEYIISDFIGRTGVEATYERYLRGIDGKQQIEVDAAGKVKDVLGEQKPQPGNNVHLTIDRDLQKVLYDALRDNQEILHSRKAAAVAMNPRTGAILALASLPSFDNNTFAKGISGDEYKTLAEDTNLPLFNRAIAGEYPPGSTIKPVLAAAGLDEGLINDKTLINDTGLLTVPNKYDPSIVYRFPGWKPGGLGLVDVYSAIAESSDIYFYTVGGGQDSLHIPGLGAEKVASWYKKFGLGTATGIDIPGERNGLVPTPEWKEATKAEPWVLGDTYHMSIGQGDVLATPLQVASWTATIANGGTVYQPYLVDSVTDEQGDVLEKHETKALATNVASGSTIDIVRQGMRQTVLAGSGAQLKTLSIEAAGKTGTSQFDGSDLSKTHAWFTSFAPFNNPEIVLTVLVEAGGEGHEAAVPVAKQVMGWYADNRVGH